MKSGFHNNRPWLTLGHSESTSPPPILSGDLSSAVPLHYSIAPQLYVWQSFTAALGAKLSHTTQSQKTHSRLQHFGVTFSLFCLSMPKRWVFFLHILLTLLLTSNTKLGIGSILCYNGQRTVLNPKCETGSGQQCGDPLSQRKTPLPEAKAYYSRVY